MATSDTSHEGSSILGVVLAGGQSSRFGSDKTLARIGGHTLLNVAIASLARWCSTMVVAGRDKAIVTTIPDWPEPGCGPLGGIAAGLRFGVENGFASILTCGVDSIGLPENTLALLSPAPAFFSTQPVVGHWPVEAASAVEAILTSTRKHSMLGFAKSIGAKAVKPDFPPGNINRPEDLVAWQFRPDRQK